jgi:EAL domain-containing protein (putative c-di-GMP-specific phosphodiesterase class I)
MTRAEQLLGVISRPVTLSDVSLMVNASLGIALIPDHGTRIDEVLQHADVAMYTAKNAGSGVEMYSPSDALASQRRFLLAADFGPTLDESRLDVWYQPQADAETGQVVGVEALLRWRHPTFGDVAPEEVIALAQRTGAIRRVTNTVLRKALEELATWGALGHSLSISVNITPTDLCDTNLPATLMELLTATGTPPSALTLEITESGVMSDPARCLAVLDALAAHGIRLSLDDFGTGHSSLAYLERLPVHELKIDRSFVRRLEHQGSDSKVVQATVALAHDLGLVVVAEGVESKLAWSQVTQLGCELIQGYAFARPMSGPDFTAWLVAMTPSVGSQQPTERLPESGGPVDGDLHTIPA